MKNLEIPTDERHRAALEFMKLTLDKELSGDTIEKILAILRSQPNSTHVYQKGSILMDILENSKTEEEFLQKMEAMEK